MKNIYCPKCKSKMEMLDLDYQFKCLKCESRYVIQEI